MKKKLLILSVAPFDSSRSRIIKEARTLSREFDPLVVALNTGEQADREEIQGVKVERISLRTKNLPKDFFSQIIKFIEFSMQVFRRYPRYDIVDCHCLVTLTMGFFYRGKYHAKLVFNAHELETERAGLSCAMKRVYKFLERRLIHSCDAVIVVSQSILSWYQNAYGKINIHCVYNSPTYREVEKTNYFREKFGLPESSKIFLYQGMLFPLRGIELVLEAFNEMEATNNYVVFMGRGPLEEEIARYASHRHILLHEMVPQDKLAEYTSSADFGLSLIEKTALSYEYCMPNKLFEYCMYEIPVIVSDTKDQADFVRRRGTGYVLENYTQDALTELVKGIDYSRYDELVRNVRGIKKEIAWDAQEKTLLDVYRNL